MRRMTPTSQVEVIVYVDSAILHQDEMRSRPRALHVCVSSIATTPCLLALIIAIEVAEQLEMNVMHPFPPRILLSLPDTDSNVIAVAVWTKRRGPWAQSGGNIPPHLQGFFGHVVTVLKASLRHLVSRYTPVLRLLTTP